MYENVLITYGGSLLHMSRSPISHVARRIRVRLSYELRTPWKLRLQTCLRARPGLPDFKSNPILTFRRDETET